jgi:predicted ArsR family transcriptional regulator|tara:strand:- start:10671 stop:10892 length:222 start_codon:yes stop_codon:yes gene_type:complete
MEQTKNQKQEKVKKRILKYLEQKKGVTANEISKKLGIHFYTAEHYLKQLAIEKKVNQLETNHLTVFMLQNGKD